MPAVRNLAKAVFDQAAELEDPAEQAAFLNQACAGDPGLRGRVEGLLRAFAEVGSFLERPVPGPAETVTLDPSASPTADLPLVAGRPGVVIGPYKLLELIGEGGMGEVWLAEQTRPVQRKVAIKLIKAGMDSKQVLARFEAERQALALMDHPNISKVFDAGTTPEGRPFFVMELVRGVPLTTYCDERRLTPRERLELFLPVCRAVQHAHQKGIVHRDLKPSNILVATYDGRPTPKVIDFGVAKATGGKLTSDTLSTQFGAVVGTLEYMSPEQAGFEACDVDTRADIYSLGVLLYELLSGLRPFDAKRLHDAALLEVIRIIREEDAPRLSSRLSTSESLASAAAFRHLDPRRLLAVVRGDLDWIVHRCLEKDRSRRYETANGLARDLERYLADEPVEARPPSAGYRLRKLLRRNKGSVLAVAGVFVALLAGLIATGLALSVARSERNVAESARIEEFNQRREADGQRQEAIVQRDRAMRADRQSRERLFEASFERAKALRQGDRPGRRLDGMAALAEAVEAARQLGTLPEHMLDLRNEVIANLSILFDIKPGRRWVGRPAGTTKIVFEPALEHYARTDAAGVSILRVADDRVLARLPNKSFKMEASHFSPDGRYLVLYDGSGANGQGLLTRVVDWRLDETIFSQDQVLTADREGSGWVEWSPDSRRFTVRHHYAPPGFRMYDVASRKQILHVKVGGPYTQLDFHPHGKVIAAASGNTLQILDAETGVLVDSIKSPVAIRDAVWGGPDGRRLAAVSGTSIYVWDVTRRSDPPLILKHPTNGGVYASFHDSGDLLMSTSWDDVTRFWDSASGQELMHTTELAPLGRSVRSFGDHLPASFGGSTIGFWEVSRFRECRRMNLLSGAQDITFSPDGRFMVERHESGLVQFRDVTTLDRMASLQLKANAKVRFNPRGNELYTLDGDGLRRWPIHVTERSVRIGPPIPLGPGTSSRMSNLAVDSGGRRVAVAADESQWYVRDLGDSGTELARGKHPGIAFIALSPDLRWLSTGTYYGTPSTQVWDLETGSPPREILHQSTITDFSVDSKWLVTSSGDEHRFWHVGTWLPGPTIQKQRELPGTLFYNRDGTLVATRPNSRLLQVINAESFGAVATFESPGAKAIDSWTLSPDSRHLGGITEHSEIVLWDLAAIRQRLAEQGLDWDSPPMPPAVLAKPVSISIDADGSPQAIDAYTSARIAANPDDVTAYLDRSVARGRLGQKREAIADLTEAIRRRPDRVDSYRARAEWSRDLREFRSAVEDFKTYLRLQSGRRLSDASRTADYLQFASLLAAAGDDAGELAALETAARLDSSNATRFNQVGLHHYNAGRFGDAIQAFREAVRLDSKNAVLHGNLADALLFSDQRDAAIAEFREAIRLDPKPERYHRFLGKALRDAGRLDEALAVGEEAVRLNPNFWLFRLGLGKTLLARGNTEAAITHLTEAVRLQPASEIPSMWLADAYRAQRQPAAALRVLEAAMKSHPNWLEDEDDWPRTRAARCAVLAGFGIGADALPAAERSALRRKALGWLSAELASVPVWLVADPFKNELIVRIRAEYWVRDTDLALVRNPWTLAFLPADEQAAWIKFWHLVEAQRHGGVSPVGSK